MYNIIQRTPPIPLRSCATIQNLSYICNELSHFARDCPQRKRESQGPRPSIDDKSTKPGSLTNLRVFSDTDESPGEAPTGVMPR